MKDAANLVPMAYDDKGMPIWRSNLSPESNTEKALVLAPPNKVIPIIFVPGIMGSNLKVVDRSKADNQTIAWRPDAAGISDIRRNAAERQTLLDPTNTEVDTSVTVKGKAYVRPPAGMSLAAAESRGWGSVMWGSYGEILHYLESNANSCCFWDSKLEKVMVSAIWQPLINDGVVTSNSGAYKLEQKELEKMAEYWFPVHAVGYNWLQSNEDSGKYLAKKIEETIAFYQKQFKKTEACEKVILITHSMGGLVARAAVHADMGASSEKVLGVIHGVMPAIGAASTYKRMRTGFEGDGSLKGWAAKQVLGSNGQEVTAVLGHAPGGLQLLPNKKYSPEGWLKVEGITADAYRIPLLGNPYKSIYEERNKWWRLVHPEWLDPNNKFANSVSTSSWDSFLVALESAEIFHDKLTAYYHSSSYVYFGSDKNFLSYGDVAWKKAGVMSENLADTRRSQETKEALMKEGSAHMLWDRGTGRTASVIDGKHASFDMTGPRDTGDGTVPSVSGIAPEYDNPNNTKFQCAISGIDHQSSYAITNTAVIKFVLYSACKITQIMN